MISALVDIFDEELATTADRLLVSIARTGERIKEVVAAFDIARTILTVDIQYLRGRLNKKSIPKFNSCKGQPRRLTMTGPAWGNQRKHER